VRGSGSIKRACAFKRHILTKKTTKGKRHLRGVLTVHESNEKSVRAMLPNG
jgi:large subunit ribosomal protein L35